MGLNVTDSLVIFFIVFLLHRHSTITI